MTNRWAIFMGVLVLAVGVLVGVQIEAVSVTTFSVTEDIVIDHVTGITEERHYFCIQRGEAIWCEKLTC